MALQRDDLKAVRQRKYLNRDFDSLRANLLEYARLYYADRLRDFSESSLGGLFLDFAASVGDNLSFYLDHQFGELDPNTAVESVNIERALKTSGVPIVGAAPAIVAETIYVQIPADASSGVLGPRVDAIPVIQAGSVFTADNGIEFILLEDVNFNKKRSDGTYLADIRVGQKSSTGVPQTFIMALSGLCVSGKETVENFVIGKTFVAFRQVPLSNPNASEITLVTDGLGNTYYPVAALSHDVVYRNVLNVAKDNDLVKDAIKVIPAPYRFLTNVDLSTRRTTLTFGGGSADTLEDDIIPDPSDFAISFPYSKTFSRIPINPQQLLQTKTLGVAATDTTLSVTYRYGGGLNHNVPVDNIKIVKTLKAYFPGNPPASIASGVRNSVEVTNLINASGGEDAPTSDDLKALIPSVRNSQERIVSREDLLARVYTLPSNFGRVFRASVRSNPNNPLATQLFIISRDADSKLIISPDTLKQNLKQYLNPYRMISDAVDVLDARVVNLTFSFDIIVDPTLNRAIVLQSVLSRLQTFFDIKNFHIDQPIVLSDVNHAVFSTPGVLSVTNILFSSITGINNNRTYSDVTYDVGSNLRNGILFPPGGGIFEVRFPEVDIIGKATV